MIILPDESTCHRIPQADDPDIILPKQWEHWCRLARLRLQGTDRWGRGVQKRGFYLRGRGHHWRVNCFGIFQLGDTYEEFDRWALCTINEVMMPTTKADFLASVEYLLNVRYYGVCDE